MSTAANHPANHLLFDSFAIDRTDKVTVVISTIQSTISNLHAGSADGYLQVLKVITRIHKPLNESPRCTKVKTAYLLVFPEDRNKSQCRWQMSDGWNESATRNDNRGDAYCLRISYSARRGTSCPFTANFVT